MQVRYNKNLKLHRFRGDYLKLQHTWCLSPSEQGTPHRPLRYKTINSLHSSTPHEKHKEEHTARTNSEACCGPHVVSGSWGCKGYSGNVLSFKCIDWWWGRNDRTAWSWIWPAWWWPRWCRPSLCTCWKNVKIMIVPNCWQEFSYKLSDDQHHHYQHNRKQLEFAADSNVQSKNLQPQEPHGNFVMLPVPTRICKVISTYTVANYCTHIAACFSLQQT